MNSATEIDRLVVTLMGDMSGAEAVFNQFEGECAEIIKVAEEATKAAMAAQNRAMAEAARITQAMLSPLERYSQELAILDGHLDQGRISQETYERAVKSLKEALPPTQAEIDQLNQKLEKEQQALLEASQAMEKAERAERELNAEMRMAQQVIDAVATPTERYSKKLADLDRLLDKGLISHRDYERAVRQMMATLPNAVAAQDRLNQKLEEEQAELREAEQVMKQTTNATERYEAEIAKLTRLLDRGRISQDTFNRGVKNAASILPTAEIVELTKANTNLQSSFQNLGGVLTQLGSTITQVGTMMTVGITAPVVAMGYAVLKATGQYEQAMAELVSASNPSIETLKAIDDRAMQLSKDLNVRPTGIVESFGELLKAGVSVEKVLGDAGQAAVQFASVGKLQTGFAATVMADALNVFGEDAVSTVDTLSAAADASSISIQQIAESFSQTAAVAGNANQSLNEVATAIAVLGNNGIKGSDAGTSLKTMLLRMMAPADKAAEVIKKYDLNLRDANGQMKPFVNLVEELNTKMGSLGQEAKDNALFDLFGQDAIRAAQIFMKEGTEGFEKVGGAMGEALSVSEKFAIQSDTLQGGWIAILAALDRAWIQVGKTITDTVIWLIQGVTQLIDGFANWVKMNPELTKMGIVVAGIAAAAGPILVVLGGMVTTLGMAVGAIAGFMAVGWEFVLLGAAIVAGIVLVIAEVIALGAAVAGLAYYLIGPESLSAAWTTATTLAQDFFMGVMGFVANFQHNMKALFIWMPSNWALIFEDMSNLAVLAFKGLLNVAGVGIAGVIRLFAALQGYLQSVFAKIFSVDFLKAIVVGLGKAIVIFTKFVYKIQSAVASALIGGFSGFGGFVETLGEDIEEGATNANFGEVAKNIIQEQMSQIENPFKDFQSSIKDGPDLLFDLGKKAGEDLQKGVEQGTADIKADPLNQARKSLEAFRAEAGETPKEIQKIIDKMKEEAATVGMSAHQKQVWRLEQQGATDDQIKEARAIADKLDAMDKEKKELEKAKKVMADLHKSAEKFSSPVEKYNATQQELETLLNKGLISVDAFNHALTQAEKNLRKEYKITFKVGGIDAVEAGTAEAQARLEQFRALQVPVKIPGMNDPSLLGPKSPIAKTLDLSWMGGQDSKENQTMEAVTVDSNRRHEDNSEMIDILKTIAENTLPEGDESFGIILSPANIGSS